MPTGAMVAFYLPQEVAQKIALPGAEPPEELHVTLSYLGEAADIEDPEKLRRQVRAFAALYQPFKASIGGIGRFNNVTDEGTQAFYASFDAQGLPKMRQRLVEMLEDAGFTQPTEWGFTPHITLAYLKPGQPNPLNEIGREEFTIDTVSLTLAGSREDYTLGEAVEKIVEGGNWNSYLDLIKVIDEEERIIEGIASAPTPDTAAGQWNGQAYEADVVEPDAIRQALPDFMKWANLREMHQPSATGIVLNAYISEEPVQSPDGRLIQNPLIIRAKVVDDNAWRKVREGVYKGFSIGGKVLSAIIGKLDGKICRFIKSLRLVEISLVDRPQNPDARILLYKVEGGNEMPQETKTEKAEGDAGKMDYRKSAIQALAAMRGEYEEKGDWKTAAGCSRAMQMVAGFGVKPEGEEDETEKAELAELLKFDEATFTKAVQPVQDNLVKVLEVVNPLAEQLKTTQDTLAKVESRLEAIEKQPVGGGPAVRAPEKKLPTDQPEAKGEAKISKAQLDELRRQANTNPDPVLRSNYQRQYTSALEALAA